MRTFLIPSTKNLIGEILGHLDKVEKDYSSNLVVFPGKRPSHFLRKALGEKEGSSFVPPRILSMDEFIDFVYEEVLGHDGRKLETMDAVTLLYQLHKASWTPLGHNDFLTPDRFFPVGLKIYRDIEELHIEGVSPSKVKGIDHIAGESIPEPTAKRLQSLSYFYDAFYQWLNENHYSSRSSRYQVVSKNAEKIPLDLFRKVIFAGFFGLTRAEKELFSFLREKENTLFFYQEGFGIREMIPDLGRVKKESPHSMEPEIFIYKSTDTHGQVFGVSSLLKKKMERRERLDEKTVIVLPSPETLFPLFHQGLSLLGPDLYNISLGYPLHRTPLFGFFSHLMELVLSMEADRLYIPYYLRFILHPYTKNIYFRTGPDVTRILFHALEEALTGKKTRKFMSLSEIEEDEGIRGFIQERVLGAEPDLTWDMLRGHLKTIHENTIQKMLCFRNVGEFAERLKEVIRYLYENSTARLHPFFHPYAESFSIQLDLIRKSLMREIEFEERGSYFTLIKKVMMTSYTPFVGTPLRGVQALGFLETRNLKFDHVLFLDLNEGILPDTTREDSLLPFKVRQALGLPTYRDREKLMAYYFDTLIQGAREVHLFYVENDEKERSRFIERVLWEQQKREGKRDDSSYVKTIQYAVTLQGKSPQAIKKTGEMVQFLRHFSFSATSLDAYLHCPLQFYYRHVLGLREREVLSDEVEREEIGRFVHQVLYDFFRGKINRVLSERDFDLKELDQILRHRFEESYGKDPAGETYLLKKQMERHLRDFIVNYQIPKVRACSLQIMHLEERMEVKKESFRLNARMDRIEKREKRVAILDYKTSSQRNSLDIHYSKFDLGKRETWSDAIETLQLPFYQIVYSEGTGRGAEGIDCMFLLLGRMEMDGSIELPLFQDESEFKDRFWELSQVIFSLLRECVNSEVPFAPTPTPKKTCRQCPYPSICNN